MNVDEIQGIDFCICTFNRVDYLSLCLEALLPQIQPGKSSITVIDNHSTDSTPDYVQSLARVHEAVHYIKEENQGLSHARNTGWKNSRHEWIYYLDDDCLPTHNLASVALDLIAQQKNIDAFGGPIYPIFTDPVPDWIPEGFGSFSMPFDTLSILDKGFVRGGNFLVRRKTLEQLGGFNTALGVKGNELRYGEEIELQMRMRAAGLRMAYVPGLRMGHHVRINKLRLGWILRSEYARRRDKMIFDPVPVPTATFHLLKTTAGRLFWTPVHLFRCATRKTYSWRKAVFDITKPLAYSTGEWVGSLQNKRRR